MAYWYDESQVVKGSSRKIEFIADTEQDIANLPTSTENGVVQEGNSTLHLPVAKGSSCLVLEPACYYILNSSDQWIKL